MKINDVMSFRHQLVNHLGSQFIVDQGACKIGYSATNTWLNWPIEVTTYSFKFEDSLYLVIDEDGDTWIYIDNPKAQTYDVLTILYHEEYKNKTDYILDLAIIIDRKLYNMHQFG